MKSVYLIGPVFLLFLLSGCQPQEKQSQEPQKKEPAPKIGRFHVVQLGTMRRDQYLLDTETGNLWVKTCAVPGNGIDCDYDYWAQEDIFGINKTQAEINNTADFVRENRKRRK